jgi:voltage-gated potassium channel Kch
MLRPGRAEDGKERRDMILLNIVIAAFMILATTVIHAGGMKLAMGKIQKPGRPWRQRLRRVPAFSIGEVVLLMFYTSLVEVLVWAAAYMALNAIQGFERALYFSMVTFTTLGYGDMVLDERWRLLASFEAANGIIMFGWTTAIVMAAIRHIYFGKKHVG